MGAGCDEDDPSSPDQLEPFTLSFAAVHDGKTVGCGDQLSGFGPNQTAQVEISDLRFYVSNLRFYTKDGEAVPIELDSNDFQYNSEHGSVALIDLTGTDSGACAGDGLSFPEGTARSNSVITGSTHPDEVHRISFDVGIPQPVMKHTIADHTAEDAPSPLREMHWSWAYAYRNFVMNFVIDDGGVAGEGYLHVGSTDCGGDGTRALTDRDHCGKLNTPAVAFEHFHLDDVVTVDIGSLLAGVDFRVAESDTSSVTVPGVACHSSPDQPDTQPIFLNLGVDMATGDADASQNSVFKVQ